jgi:hypothetical protein
VDDFRERRAAHFVSDDGHLVQRTAQIVEQGGEPGGKSGA